MPRVIPFVGALFALLSLALFSGCGSSSATTPLPLITPPVRSVTPVGLKGARTLDPAEFKTVFFTSGPAVLFNILGTVDTRLQEINDATGTHACTTQTPVAYTLTPWAGQSIAMVAQCYRSVGTATATDPQFFMWGKDDAGKIYLWVAIGDGWIAAIVTASARRGTTSAATTYQIHAWYSVGVVNGFGAGSYGVAEIFADTANNVFEMSTAGKAMGYCGAQLRSDGTNVYATGSAEGAGVTCDATDETCVDATDLTTAATCTTAQKTFTLPALGRDNSNGLDPSTYPASSNVTLDGTSTDSVHFGDGPTTPPAGVTEF